MSGVERVRLAQVRYDAMIRLSIGRATARNGVERGCLVRDRVAREENQIGSGSVFTPNFGKYVSIV